MTFTGYLVIYNIFQISVAGDIRYYGLLKTIGVTPKQLRRSLSAPLRTRQGSRAANVGAHSNASDRNLQPQRTPQAKMPTEKENRLVFLRIWALSTN